MDRRAFIRAAGGAVAGASAISLLDPTTALASDDRFRRGVEAGGQVEQVA